MSEQTEQKRRFKQPRFRNQFLVIGSILVAILFTITDPQAHLIQDLPFGANTVLLLIGLMKAIWFLGILHASRKALFDYIDMEELIKAATRSPEGAGKAIIGIGLFMIASSICILAAVISN